MYTLGVGQIGGLDSSVVLLRDEKLLWAVQEERLTRIKHVGGYPEKSIAWCLRNCNISLSDIEHIGLVDQPYLRLIRRAVEWYLPTLFTHPTNTIYHLFRNEIPLLLDFVRAKDKLIRQSEGKAKVYYLNHHLCHAASVFFPSPFEEAAIWTVDARGEVVTLTIGIGQGRSIKTFQTVNMPASLGMFYAGITDYLGFKHSEDEYKVMGMASYGEPYFIDDFRRIIRFDPDRILKLDLSYITYHQGRGFFSQKFTDLVGPARKPGAPLEDRHFAIAASAQKILEDIGIQIARLIRSRTQMRNLCIAGGVALNCVMNGKIVAERIFDRVFVPPAAGDDGGALGAAYLLYNRYASNPRKFVLENANLGPGFTDKEIEYELLISKVPYRKTDSIVRETAAMLRQGKIIGWFQGRMEFGPRALGCRSILADPTQPGMKDLINKYVKHREEFRPFAPAVKADRASDYFVIDFESPYMLFVADVKAEAKLKLPAITHVDGTARVQSVRSEQNPIFYDLIDEFEKLSGIPVVLNTSFNVAGEPIVCTPHEAIRCFYSTGLDALCIGSFIVDKNNKSTP